MTPEAKEAFLELWNQGTPEEQAEQAFGWWCEIAQRRSQQAGRINQANAEFWELKGFEQDTKRKRKHGALVKHATDPARNSWNKVRENWQEWKKDKATYKTKAAFARDMLDAYPDLTSQKTIEDKCRLWEKAAAEKV